MINNFLKSDFSGGCIETVKDLKTASSLRYRNIKLSEYNKDSSLSPNQKHHDKKSDHFSS